MPEENTEADDLIWGVNAVHEALQGEERINEVLVERGKGGGRLQEIIELARSRQVRVRFVEADRMGVPRGCRHQGVVARQSAAPLLPLVDFLDHLRHQEGSPRLLVLDSIQDPRNLGSILRSALAAGFKHVILSRERSAPVTGTVVRTSAGATSHLTLCQVVNVSDTLKQLKKEGFWIYGAVPDRDAVSLYDVDFSGAVCCVIGSEGKGIRPLVKKQCDHLITIPMQADFDSLNASVAAAIIMFEAVRQQLLA